MVKQSNYDQQVRDFFGYLRVEAGLSPATIEAYRHDLLQLQKDLTADGVHGAGDVSPAHLAAHIRGLHRTNGLQPSSVARHLSTIRMFFRYLQASNRIAEDPARLLETPTRWRRLPNVLSPNEGDRSTTTSWLKVVKAEAPLQMRKGKGFEAKCCGKRKHACKTTLV